MRATYSRIMASGRSAGGCPCWRRMAGAETPRPSQTSASGLSACSVAADMAASAGVRSWMGTMPVPSPMPGATADTVASGVNASVPVASAVQSDP